MSTPAGTIISTILKHDAKVTSYKIALLRAINDVVLSFPTIYAQTDDVAIPLHMLASSWIGYYLPFMDSANPIRQGQKQSTKNDVAFRPQLTQLRSEWEAVVGVARPADGFFLVNELRIERKRSTYPASLLTAYEACRKEISKAFEMPICYAGPGQWTVFARPKRLRETSNVVALPGTHSSDMCLVVTNDLWRLFADLSLWIEALCIHEWCLFTENNTRNDAKPIDRGAVYRLLTDRPDNRRPLTWERNQIDLLMMEGNDFHCPWTERLLKPGEYAVDHIIPIAVMPINEMWNLVPSDAHYNSHVKRHFLPSTKRLAQAEPFLIETYTIYQTVATLGKLIHEDVNARFSAVPLSVGVRGVCGKINRAVYRACGKFAQFEPILSKFVDFLEPVSRHVWTMTWNYPDFITNGFPGHPHTE